MSIIDLTVCVTGEVESGKTSFIRRSLTSEFISERTDEIFEPTEFNTTYGVVRLNMIETDEAVSNNVVILIDGSDKKLFRERVKSITSSYSNRNVLIIINKCDLLTPKEQVALRLIITRLGLSGKTHFSSNKTCIGCVGSFDDMFRTFLNKPDLKFVHDE